MTNDENSEDLREDESGLEQDGTEFTEIEIPFDPSKIDIQVKVLSVSSLQSRLQNDELDLTPDFQRQANVWDVKRKSRLIESVLLRIPLPSFYFSEDSDGVYAVVDGLQRLSTLFHFMNHAELNRATDSKLGQLELRDLQYLKELNGCSYASLDRKFQRRITELEITANVIRPSTPSAVKFNVFARLNQGGMPVNAQEIRNAIYPGIWRKKLQGMVESRTFKDVTEGKIKSQRQQDIELALRFVALWQLKPPFVRPYSQTLDDFLNDVVDRQLRGWDDKKWEAVTKAFERSLIAASKIFGKHAFRKSVGQNARSPINRGLFEAQLVALSEMSNEAIEALITGRTDVITRLARELKTGCPLAQSLTYGTGSADSSNIRTRALLKIFNEAADAN